MNDVLMQQPESNEFHGFVVFVDARLGYQEREDLRTALFSHKGVTAINAIGKEFDIYSIQAMAEQLVRERIVAALSTGSI